LEQVAVVMQPSTECSLTEDFIIPLPSLSATTSPGIVYVSFTRDSPEEYASGSFQCALKFVSKEVDPSTGEPEEEGYEDEYQLEEVELGAGDYIIPTYVTFSTEWDRLRGGASATETFSLSAMESLKGGSTPLGSKILPLVTKSPFPQLPAIPSLRFSTCKRWEARRTLPQPPFIHCNWPGWSLVLEVLERRWSGAG